MKRLFVGGVLALGLFGAACSNYGGVTTNTSAPAATSAAATTAGGATSAPASSAPATTGGGAASCSKSTGTVSVTQQNFQFNPTKLTGKSCSTVKVTNKDTFAHTFTIPGTAINLTLSGPGTQTVQLNIKPGTYVFYCRFHGSPDGSGMAGHITVT